MKKIILATPDCEDIAKNLSNIMGIKHGKVEVKIFPDGEHYIRLKSCVYEKDVYLVCSSHNNRSTMISYDLASGICQYGAKRLNMIMPYFSYSTMERASKVGEVVTTKNRAKLFSSIPKCPYGNRFYSVDLHADGIPHYFENTQFFHIYAKEIVVNKAVEVGGTRFVLASTDMGRAKWVESLANDCNKIDKDMDVTTAYINKKRLSGTKTEILSVDADVKDQIVVIYDDMIRTGGSLISAAKAYKDNGAKEVFCIATHGVLAEPGPERLKNALKDKIIDGIAITNTHPSSANQDFADVMKIETVLAREIFEKQLFKGKK